MKLMKTLGILPLLCFSISFGTNSMLDNSKQEQPETREDLFYSEPGDDIILKLRVHGLLAKGKHKNLPKATSSHAEETKNPQLLANGIGGEVSTTIFLHEQVGAELGLGFSVFRTKKTALCDIAYNYNENAENLTFNKRSNIYAIPLTFTLQYHPFPYGGIKPYVGAGYAGVYLLTDSKYFKVNSITHGPVLQIGGDFVLRDDTYINFDVKKYFYSMRVSYKESVIGAGNGPIKGNVKAGPFVISLGVGYKF